MKQQPQSWLPMVMVMMAVLVMASSGGFCLAVVEGQQVANPYAQPRPRPQSRPPGMGEHLQPRAQLQLQPQLQQSPPPSPPPPDRSQHSPTGPPSQRRTPTVSPESTLRPNPNYGVRVKEPYEGPPKLPGPISPYNSGQDCKYDEPPWSDCDPFHLIRWRNQRLVSGIDCQLNRNETKQCNPTPGTKWFIAEHKKSIQQLERLKNMIGELRRWIDVIHERGEDMFRAFHDLRKHLDGIQGRIRELHRRNHDDHVQVERLTNELREWKENSRKLQVELEELKSKYGSLQKDHAHMKDAYIDVHVVTQECDHEQVALRREVSSMIAENRELRNLLMDAHRYEEMVSAAERRIANLHKAIGDLHADVDQAKADRQRCRVDVLNAKNRRPPAYGKDTHVNLDMQMWVTHNQTKDEYEKEQQQQLLQHKSQEYSKNTKTWNNEENERHHPTQAAQTRNYVKNDDKSQEKDKYLTQKHQQQSKPDLKIHVLPRVQEQQPPMRPHSPLPPSPPAITPTTWAQATAKLLPSIPLLLSPPPPPPLGPLTPSS